MSETFDTIRLARVLELVLHKAAPGVTRWLDVVEVIVRAYETEPIEQVSDRGDSHAEDAYRSSESESEGSDSKASAHDRHFSPRPEAVECPSCDDSWAAHVAGLHEEPR